MRTLLSALSAILLTVLLAPAAVANPPTIDVPLSAEPAPLTVNPFQPFTVWTVYPASCTAVASVDGPVCVEQAEVWACPTALSLGAVLRAEPAYNEVRALAYRSTHCELEGRVKVVAADWPRLARQVLAVTPTPTPTPAPTNPCPADGVLTDHPTLGIICVFTSDGVLPAEVPPEIAFTGAETTVAAMLGLGLVSTGAAVLGVRRRMVGDDEGEGS